MMDKAVIFVVEGKTDKTALENIFKKIYRHRDIQFEFTRGDITSDENITEEKVKEEIYKIVKKYMDYAKLKKSNVFQIIQIFDTDGTYIDESHITKGDTEEFVYSETEISCKYPERVKARNIHKKELMNFLLGETEIENIPYECYFMSCNLDHVLYNKNNLTDAEKEKYADKFQQMFIGKEERFIPYIKNLATKDMPNSHPGSWRYIKEERHSLERNSNLGIYFDRNPLL